VNVAKILHVTAFSEPGLLIERVSYPVE